ncbi:MAG: DUF4434 domain-containing protein [Actinomycetota bacterium]|nr:DUF4434 domain-containing protein [Actinomycetota bacterium]
MPVSFGPPTPPPPAPPPVSYRGGTVPAITGTFIQESTLLDVWTGNRWSQELSDMSAVGIKTQILQWTLDEDNQKTLYPGPPTPIIPGSSRTVTDGVTNGTTNVTSATAAFVYPTDVGKTISGGSIPPGATITSITSATAVTITSAATASATGVTLTIGGTPYNIGPDYVDPLLFWANQYNDDVWLGLANFGAWQAHATDATWLNQQLALQKTTAQELWALYGTSPAFTGWYISFEIDANLLTTPAAITPMTNYFTALISWLHTNYPSKLVMVSPTYSIYGVKLSPTAYAAALPPVVAGVDVINLQSGSANQTTATVASYYSSLALVLPGSTALWANMDMFANGPGPLDPAKLQADLKAVAPYVAKITGFSFPTQMGPHDLTDRSAFTAYQAYLATLPVISPLAAPFPGVASHAPRYTVMLCDLVTNQPTAILPMVGLSFDAKLNNAGALKCSLPLFDPRVQNSNWDAATTPARSVIYVLRNDTVVWGGIIWARGYDSTRHMEDFTAASFESFYMHVPFGVTRQYVNTDQLAIVRDLVNTLGLYAPVLPMSVSANTSGVLRNFDVFGYDWKWTSDIIRALQQLPDGFDFGADVYYSPGSPPYARFNLGYPRRGRTTGTTPLVFEYPGNVDSYKVSEDGTAYASDVIELGAGQGPTMMVGRSIDTTLWAAGWPNMVAQVSRKDEVDQGRLDAYARGDIAIYRQPIRLFEVKVRADSDPLLGTYIDGDDCRLRITDDRYPAPGLDIYARVETIKTAVGDDGHEDITLSLIHALA